MQKIVKHTTEITSRIKSTNLWTSGFALQSHHIKYVWLNGHCMETHTLDFCRFALYMEFLTRSRHPSAIFGSRSATISNQIENWLCAIIPVRSKCLEKWIHILNKSKRIDLTAETSWAKKWKHYILKAWIVWLAGCNGYVVIIIVWYDTAYFRAPIDLVSVRSHMRAPI